LEKLLVTVRFGVRKPVCRCTLSCWAYTCTKKIHTRLPDSLELDSLSILFWFSAYEQAGSRNFAFVGTGDYD